MYQRLIGKVGVDEGNASSYPLQGKPEHQVFGTISTVYSNQFACSDPKVVHEPVTDSLQVVEELLVRP
jgi:hypothetical protein